MGDLGLFLLISMTTWTRLQIRRSSSSMVVVGNGGLNIGCQRNMHGFVMEGHKWCEELHHTQSLVVMELRFLGVLTSLPVTYPHDEKCESVHTLLVRGVLISWYLR